MDSSKNKASQWSWQRELLPLKGHQQGPSTSQSGPYLRNDAEKILHSLCETSLRFFVYLYQVLNRRPLTIEGYRTAIFDKLGPAGHHIPQARTLTGYSPVFLSDRPYVPGIFQNGTFSVVLNELRKASFEPMRDTASNIFSLKLLSC